MRLINVSVPLGKSQPVVRLAFSAGIEKAAVQQEESRQANGASEIREIVKIETSTPKGKKFIDAVLTADFFDSERYSIVVRAPLSIISREGVGEITRPLPETGADVLAELYQFSHITYSFAGRILIAASLLAYGMIQSNLLLMIAGLLFLPLLPLLQAVGFGAWTRQWKLFLQGLSAFVLGIILLVAAGAVVALLSAPPVRYNELSSPVAGFLISLAVGFASGLAMIDDAGKREMIGLAAGAQTALIPVWFGISLVFGFSKTAAENEIQTRILSFFANVAALIAASLAVHLYARTANGALQRIDK